METGDGSLSPCYNVLAIAIFHGGALGLWQLSNVLNAGELYQIRLNLVRIAEHRSGRCLRRSKERNLKHRRIRDQFRTVYDGKYGVISLVSFRHGLIDGEQKYERPSTILPGKTKVIVCSILDSDAAEQI